MNVGIYIYNKAEVLDFSGPFEVFSTASRVCCEDTPFNVFLIGESGDTVVGRAGYKVVPHYGFHNHPAMDVFIIAGGDHSEEMKKPQVNDWIAKQAELASTVASVCTGAFLLAQAKVLQRQRVTTHWEDISNLQHAFPELEVVDGVRWVDDDGVITSGGISSGIDMSLYLVAKLHSEILAEKTARQMDFLWTKNA